MISALLCTAPLVQGQTHPPVYYHHPEMSQKVVFPAPETGSRGYDVQSYDLELVLDPSVQTVSGRVNIGLLALDNNLRQIHLDLTENMQCLQIDFNHTAVMFSHLADSLMVTLPRDLSLTTCDTLTVYYQGRPLPHGSFYAGLMFRKHDSGTPDNDGDDAPIIASVSETWSAHSWWPCKDHPSDKALISIKATVPDTLSLVSNGTLEGSYLERPGWQTYAWRERHPLPTYLVSVAASNYRSWHEDCLLTSAVGSDQNIPLGFHVFPQQEPEALIDFQNTCEALQFMVDLAGPYPYEGEKYDQATIRWAGAMEHATATSLPEYFFTGNNQYENFLVHEIAHHWFGNNLTCGRWSDIWLNEGFARYCEALWIEHNQGHAAYAQYMYTIGPVIHENLFVGDGFLADPNPILPNFMVYDKGAWVLHSLRTLLGDEVFFSILANYAQDTQLQHGNSETRDFIRHAENRSGLNLDTFFTPWLYTETVAQLAHKIDYPGGFSSGTVEIHLQQLQNQWIQMGVPVVIHCQDGDSPTTLILDCRQKNFRFEFECPVDSVSIDPAHEVLMTLGQEIVPSFQVKGPWPNPSNDGEGNFRLYLLEGSQSEVKMYDARGYLQHQWDLGFLAATGPLSNPESLPHDWILTANQTNDLASGVYWLEFKTQRNSTVKKWTLVR